MQQTTRGAIREDVNNLYSFHRALRGCKTASLSAGPGYQLDNISEGHTRGHRAGPATMSDALKLERDPLFKKLRGKPDNKVGRAA